MTEYWIYTLNNYLFIDKKVTGEPTIPYEGHAKNVLFKRSTEDSTKYNVKGLDGFNEFTDSIDFSLMRDGEGDVFASQDAFETWYTANTGNFNGGGSAPFNPSDYDLSEFTNVGADRFVQVSGLPEKLVYQCLITTVEVGMTSGSLVIGNKYYVHDPEPGDDFTNIGLEFNQGAFIATGTTPANWSNGTYVIDVIASAPEIFELENSLGVVTWEYISKGSIRATSVTPLLSTKTVLTPVGMIYLCAGLINGEFQDKEAYRTTLSGGMVNVEVYRDEEHFDGILYRMPVKIEVYP